MQSLYSLTVTELIEKIKSREISSEEIVKECFQRIHLLEPLIHAWVCFNEEQSIRRAKIIDSEMNQGAYKGRLCGIPLGIKDIFNTADFPTEMGSFIWKGFNSGNDARVVFNLNYEGGIVIGKTKTSEFAVHEPTDTCNPHDLRRAPGTSSGGSAAAVAAGMVPFALGSQTAGSTIRPASYCGIFGYKPSFGLVPRTGVLKTTDTLDTVGWFARSIDDLELFFDILRVQGENYPLVNQHVVRSSLTHPLKIGLYKGLHWEKAEPHAQDALLNAAIQLSALGIVEEVYLSESQEIYDAHELIYCKALSYYFRAEQRNTRDHISRVLVEMLDRGESTTTEAYLSAVSRQSHLTRTVPEHWTHDVWITLSAGGEAPIGLRSPDRMDSCKIWTYLGMPVISLPLFQSPDGMPIGLQIVAKKYNDYLLLDIARQIWTCLKGRYVLAEPLKPTEALR